MGSVCAAEAGLCLQKGFLYSEIKQRGRLE